LFEQKLRDRRCITTQCYKEGNRLTIDAEEERRSGILTNREDEVVAALDH
jgi:hypothetical protein